MGNGAFSEISAFLKNVRGAFGDWLRYFFNKNFSVYFRRGKYIAEDRAFFAGFLSDFKMWAQSQHRAPRGSPAIFLAPFLLVGAAWRG